ncbi:MAG: hypothetical protein Kow0090_02160 [Myxococcota bacterium]
MNGKIDRNEQDLLGDEAITTRADEAINWLQKVVNWGRKNSFFQYPFVTACCAMEFMAVWASRYDIARFGAEVPRFTPRQSDVLFVVGTVNHKQAPILKRIYEQMAEPKWVVAFGACASSGGFYDNYATLQGIGRLLPVDLYIPGCPPRPETILDGLLALQRKVETERPPLLERVTG